jgi:hypothetical protein
MLLDGGKPKVPPEELTKVILRAGLSVTEGDADFGIVVGGDGRFSRYGRTESIPLLFVGVRSKGAAGSRAFLAGTTFDRLEEDLVRIRGGDYFVDAQKRLDVVKNGRSVGEVFTDTYLQRGSESSCIRYRVKVSGPGLNIEDAAIGDGVVVTTKAGSTGYYSYPDRIKGDSVDPMAHATIERDQIGVCHISPTFTERQGSEYHPLRYTVPWGSKIELSLFRSADARLYGTTDSRGGVKVSLDDRVTVVPGKNVTKVLVLGKKRP